jgi:contractile injection system tube protein
MFAGSIIMQLQKAIIAELDDQNKAVVEFPVQFNPTTLKLTLNNQIEGGKSHGKQVRQFIGSSSTTLSLDLIFDTADEGATESPRSVREKTANLERFLIPRDTGQKQKTPPRMRFTWGDLIIEGITDSLTIDFDHFAANGVPLRAKASLTIKEQDPKRELQPVNDSRRGAATPGRAGAGGLGGNLGAGLGVSGGIGLSAGLGVSAGVGLALDGESAAEFAARVGVDAATWRGLELGGESSLSLSAGTEIGFSAGLNASAGLGVTVGLEAGVSASAEASFGLEASAGLSAVAGVGVGTELTSGFALSAGGGVSAAIESVQTVKNYAAEQQTREAFNAPPKPSPVASIAQGSPSSAAPIARGASSPPMQPAPPEQNRRPLKNTGLPSISAQQAARAAPTPPRADARASSFGLGAPLRPTVGAAAVERANSINGAVAVKSKFASGEPPMTDDPTTPPWVALPARDRSRKVADKINRPPRPCGCAGRCKH